MKLKRVIGTAIAAMMVVPMFAANAFAYEGVDIPVTAEYFPDEEFRNYIISNFNFDYNNDVGGVVYLSSSEINSVSTIDVDDVIDFTGIEYFTEITCFETCNENDESIKCLDLSANTKLIEIYVEYSNIDSLIIGQNDNLEGLYIYNTQISEIDVSGCPKLYALEIDNTNIKELDISNNGALAEVYLTASPVSYTSYTRYSIPADPYNHILDISPAVTTVVCDAVMLDKATFEDDNFRAVVNDFDSYTDGVLTRDELNAVYSIDCSSCNVSSLKGIEKFPNLERLYAYSNNISSVDFSKNTKLAGVDLSDNNLSAIDVSMLPDLYDLSIVNNNISSLNVSYNPKLQYLLVYNNKLTSLDTSKNPELYYLDISHNTGISSLNLNNNKKLYLLDIGNTAINSFDFSIFPDLGCLYIYNTSFASVDISHNPKLTIFSAMDVPLTSINLSNNPELEGLFISNTNISSIDISTNTKLNSICTDGSKITSLNISNNPSLITIKNQGTYFGGVDFDEYDYSTDDYYWYMVVNPGTKLTTDRPAETTVEGFAERLYTCALNRPSEPEGKQTWVDVLYDGSWNGAQVAEGFFFSDELMNKKPVTDEEFVRRLYATFMGRTPDQAGFDTWMGVLANGGTRQDVFNGFIESQEWANVCFRAGIVSGGQCAPNITLKPTEDITAFATRLYTTCLNRKGEAKGVSDWANFIANRIFSGTEAAFGFFFSDEFKAQNVSNSVYVDRLYRTFMNREGEKSGRDMWIGLLDRGEWSREQVFYGFADSAEFIRICREAGIRNK